MVLLITIKMNTMPETSTKIRDATPLPVYTPTFYEISTQMRINQKIIMEEITEHVNKEIQRLKTECAIVAVDTQTNV